MEADLTGAIRNVFVHPNVGAVRVEAADPEARDRRPVAAVRRARRRGVQRQRAGVRGDLKAVVRAILLDPEARGDVKLDAGYGKLREPVLFVTGAARAVGTRSDGVRSAQIVGGMGQNLFYAPSVFNYYPPDYVVPGTTAMGPEFAIQNSSTFINRENAVNTLAFGTIAPLASYPGATGTQPDWAALQAVAGDAERARRPARRAAAARHDAGRDAVRARGGRQRGAGDRHAHPGEDGVLPRRHFVRIPGGALEMKRPPRAPCPLPLGGK